MVYDKNIYSQMCELSIEKKEKMNKEKYIEKGLKHEIMRSRW